MLFSAKLCVTQWPTFGFSHIIIYHKVLTALREPQMCVVLSYYADLKQEGECNQWPLYALCYGRFMLYVTEFVT